MIGIIGSEVSELPGKISRNSPCVCLCKTWNCGQWNQSCPQHHRYPVREHVLGYNSYSRYSWKVRINIRSGTHFIFSWNGCKNSTHICHLRPIIQCTKGLDVTASGEDLYDHENYRTSRSVHTMTSDKTRKQCSKGRVPLGAKSGKEILDGQPAATVIAPDLKSPSERPKALGSKKFLHLSPRLACCREVAGAFKNIIF